MKRPASHQIDAHVESLKQQRRQRRLVYALVALAMFGAGYWVRLLTTPLVEIYFGCHRPASMSQSERL